MSERRDRMGALAEADAGALLDDGTVAGRWVLDPAGSRAEFHVKHFWGAVTVHGSFGQITGEGSVGPDGTVTGRVCIEASSLGTGNKKRDEHLRSADFFDAGRHPQVVLTVTAATPVGRRPWPAREALRQLATLSRSNSPCTWRMPARKPS